MTALLGSLLWYGCAGGGGGPASPVGDVAQIAIEPASAALTTRATAAATQDFRVVATFDDGSVDEDFPLVTWTLSNTAAGSVDGDGLFTASTFGGGRTLLSANCNGQLATADLTVTYEETAVDEGLDPEIAALFEGEASAAGDGLRWDYPEDGVAVPRNLPEFTFMWADSLDADLFALRFSSSTTAVTAVTEQQVWTAPAALWDVITATNAGEEVSVTLLAARTTRSGDEITGVDALYQADPIALRINRFDAVGAVYYWSVDAAGVMRSGVDEAAPDDYFGPALTHYCVGCHVISDDGERLAYAFQVEGETSFRMGLASPEQDGGDPTVLLNMDTSRDHATYATFSPDGSELLFSYGGKLHRYDGRDGAPLGDVSSDLKLTQPHWSPDGQHVVAISATKDFVSDSNFNGGELVVFTVDEAGVWSDPEVLVERVTGVNQYYPMYSPDGDWVVFNRSVGTSYFNEDATLWLVSAEGGEPIKLDAANRDHDLTNSWPRWGPVPDDDVLWLAFASTRDYGSLSTDQTAHIWVTAIDTKLAEEGKDPSFPAFWLVQQQVGGGNHAAWWSLY